MWCDDKWCDDKLRDAAVIRPALPNDAHDIAQVHLASWRTTYGGIFPDALLANLNLEGRTTAWQEILRDPAQINLVAVDPNGKIAGFAGGGKERTGNLNCDGELYAIYLRQEAQRQGLGTQLVRQFAQELRRRQMTSMAAWVLAANPARQFYEALGAHIMGQRTLEGSGQTYAEIAYGWTDLTDL